MYLSVLHVLLPEFIRRRSGSTVVAVLSAGSDTCVGSPDEPVAVVADVGRDSVASVLSVSSVRAVGAVTPVFAVSSVASVLSLLSRVTFLAFLSTDALCGDARVGVAYPPVSVADEGRPSVGAIAPVTSVRSILSVASVLALLSRVTLFAFLSPDALCGDARVGVADPPVSVADDGCLSVGAVASVTSVPAFRSHAGVGRSNPPVSVRTDVGGQSVLAVASVRTVVSLRSLRGDSGIRRADEPVSVGAHVGCDAVGAVAPLQEEEEVIHRRLVLGPVGSALPDELSPLLVSREAVFPVQSVASITPVPARRLYAGVRSADEPVAVAAHVGRLSVASADKVPEVRLAVLRGRPRL